MFFLGRKLNPPRPILSIGALCLLAATSMAPQARSCSLVMMSLPGAIGPDGSVAYALDNFDEERPGVARLEFFDRRGTALGGADLQLEVDATIHFLSMDAARNVWLKLHCYGSQRGDLCGKALRFSASGEKIDERDLGQAGRILADPSGVALLSLTSGPDGLRLEGPPGTRTHEIPLRQHAQRVFSTAIAADGSMAFSIKDQSTVHFARWTPDGQVRETKRFPLAGYSPDGGADDQPRLGPLGALAVAEDGTLFSAQWGLAANCDHYQPASVAILDPSGELVAVPHTDKRPVGSLRVVGKELLALLTDGKLLRFDFKGTRLGAWNPGIGHWENLRSEEEQAAFMARVAAISPQDSPEFLARAIDWTPLAKRQDIIGWLVDAGPGAYTALDDSLWQDISEELCSRHPQTAPAETLRRLRRSRGDQAMGWLEALPKCFSEAPPGIMERALALRAAGDGTDATGAIFEAWGYPDADIDAMWRRFTGSKGSRSDGQRLLRIFDQAEDRFEQTLLHGQESERLRTLHLLLESSSSLGPHTEVVDAYRVRGAQRALAEAAGRWSGDDDEELARVGRLMQLGFGVREPAEALPDLLEDVSRNPAFFPWLAFHLGQVVGDGAELDLLPQPSLDSFLRLALEARTDIQVETVSYSGLPMDPYGDILDLRSERVRALLLERAFRPDGSPQARRRLLEKVEAEPWFLAPHQLGDLLDSAWLADPATAWEAIAFLGSLHADLDGLETPFRARVAQRYRSLVQGWIPEVRACEKGLGQWWTQRYRLDATFSREEVARLMKDGDASLMCALPKIASVGVWPELEPEVRALVESNDPKHALFAAMALSPTKNATALDVLLHEGMRWSNPYLVSQPPGASTPYTFLHPYGDLAREKLAPRVLAEQSPDRSEAILALRTLGASRAVSDRLAVEADAVLQEGALPEVQVVLLLHGVDPGVMPRVLERLLEEHTGGSASWDAESRAREFWTSHSFARAVRLWLEQEPRRHAAVAPMQERFPALLSDDALSWRAAVRKVTSAPTPAP